MSDKELKNTANMLTDAFLENEDNFTHLYDDIRGKIKTVREGYIIGRLCDIYRSIKTGTISKDEGVQMQNDVFIECGAV